MLFNHFLHNDLRLINQIELMYCSIKLKLYFISRYKRIEVLNEATKVDHVPFGYKYYLIILIDLHSKFKSVVIAAKGALESNPEIIILSSYSSVESEKSDSLQNHSNQYISHYDYFFKLTFTNFSCYYFVKKALKLHTKSGRVLPWYSGKIGSYFNHDNQYFRIINIVYKQILHSPYKEIEEDVGVEGIDSALVPKDKNRFIEYKFTTFEHPIKHLYFVYDIETIPNIKDKKHYPFCLVATHFILEQSGIEFNNEIQLNKEELSNEIFEFNILDQIDALNTDRLIWAQHRVGEEFALHIKTITLKYKKEDMFSDYKVHVVGFNNRNFDDHHIIEDFLRIIQYYKREYCKRDLKVVSHRIMTYNLDNTPLQISFDDVSIWLPEISSLKMACLELDIELTKLDFNIVKFNQYVLDKGEVITNFSFEEFFEFWKGNLSMIKGMYNRCKKTNNINLFDNFFKKEFIISLKELGITNLDSKVPIIPFITLYCRYDVFATSQLYIVLYKTFNTCLIQVFEEFNLSDLVINKHYSYEKKIYDDELRLTIKNEKNDYLSFEHLNMSNYLTPSQVAYNIFKLLYKDNKRLNVKYDPSLMYAINDSFFGGIVVFGGIGKFVGRVNGEDLRSMYSIASLFPMPLLNDKYDYRRGNDLTKTHINNLNRKIQQAVKIRNELFQNRKLHIEDEIGKVYKEIDFLGLYYCVVSPPSITNISMVSPLILAISSPNGNRKVNLYNIPFKKFFSTPHIKNFILFGWSVKILHDVNNIQYCYNKLTESFESCYQEVFCYMKKYIDFFNEKKALSDNKVSKKLFKFFMNAIFGRLAMRTDAMSTTLTESNSLSNGYEKKLDREKGLDFNKSDKWLAVFINSNAHNIILESIYILELEQIYQQIPIHLRQPVNIYTDTDSIYYLVDNATKDVKYVVSKELGSFNLNTCRVDKTWSVKHNPDKITKFVVLFKKGYVIADEDDVIEDFKTKGVPQSDIKSKFYDSKGKLNSEFDLLYTQSVAIDINRLTNKTNRDSLQKEFYNNQIVKKIIIDQLDTGKKDFSWKPAIIINDQLRVTHSPCNCCEYCLDWYNQIRRHKFYTFD
jgi:hypothetical protein